MREIKGIQYGEPGYPPITMDEERDLYLAMLNLPLVSPLRATQEVQSMMAFLRDRIASNEGRTSEDIQTECEMIAARSDRSNY